MRTIRIGTRGSNLALWQAQHIENLLRENQPGVELKRVIIKTEGDRDQKTSLTQIGGQGVFTKAIEDALLDNQIDLAVHSLKDLPTTMPPELILTAVPPRGPVEDVLVTKKGLSWHELRQGSRIATGSIRRRSQLLNLRPDIITVDLRGNIETRLKKLDTQNLDGIIMAQAALVRLKYDNVSYQPFTVTDMVPGVGQGAIGVQIRRDDDEVQQSAATINHRSTFLAVQAERAFLRELNSGCQFPVGAYGILQDETITLTGFVGSADGKTVIKDKLSGSADQAELIGQQLARRFLKQDAGQLLI